MPTAIDSLTEALGGRKVFPKALRNENEMVRNIRLGLPIAAVDALIEGFGLTNDELAAILGISVSTMKRRHQQDRLTAPVSDRLYRVAKIVTLATQTLGNREKATRWLHKPNRSLNGDTPISRLDTMIGFSQVEQTLLRIEHGLPS